MSQPLPLPPSRRKELGEAGPLDHPLHEALAAIEEENALLLRQRAELRARLIQSQDVLTELARTCRGDSQKLEGKVQGLGLALFYLDEYIAGRPA